MLVFSRQAGEEIVVGQGEIIIKVVAVQGNKVRIGIVAPDEVPINRREVFDAMQKRGSSAASLANHRDKKEPSK